MILNRKINSVIMYNVPIYLNIYLRYACQTINNIKFHT